MPGLRIAILQTARILPSCAGRPLHQTATGALPYKDDMDRESLKPKAHEYTQSGTDDEVATAHSNASFNPNETSPEREKEMAAQDAAKQDKQNPLEASPANIDFAKAGAGVKEGALQPGRSNRSTTGNAPKGKAVNQSHHS